MNYFKALYDKAMTTAGTPFARAFLYLFSFLESIIIPIPTDPLLGACTHAKPEKWKIIAIYCAAASVIGGAVGWAIGAFASEWVIGLVDKLPHAVMSAEKFAAVAEGFNKIGLPLVLIGAFTPLPFKVIAISAGLFGYPLLSFIAVATFGRMARFLLVSAMVRYHRNLAGLTALISIALIFVLISFWFLTD